MGWNILHKATHRPLIFYGWLIVTIAFVMAFVMAGSGSAFGVFVIPMSAEFAWNRSLISVAFLFSTLVSGLAQPFLGHLCDRCGGRKVIVVSLMMMGVCTMLLSLTFHIIFLILLYGVVMSIFRSGGSLGSTSWIIGGEPDGVSRADRPGPSGSRALEHVVPVPPHLAILRCVRGVWIHHGHDDDAFHSLCRGQGVLQGYSRHRLWAYERPQLRWPPGHGSPLGQVGQEERAGEHLCHQGLSFWAAARRA